MTARELKNATGDVVRTLRRGESIVVTFRGKPLGTIAPARGDDLPATAVSPYREAWAEIEAQLRGSTPHFASWQEAEAQSRGRR